MEDFLHIRYKENEDVIDIINIYVPNKVAERSSFFFMLYQKKIPRSNNLMILGDFNNTLGEIDRCGKKFTCMIKVIKLCLN